VRDIAARLEGWLRAGAPFAVATVVGVRGSAPRQPGAVMAVHTDGEVLGSVSGGCVEGAVYEAAAEVLRTGAPTLETYGISDADAFAVGLTCGGVIDVLVAPGGGPLPAVLGSISADEPVALATVIGGETLGRRVAVWPDRVSGGFGIAGLDAAVVDDARGMLAADLTGTRYYDPGGERREHPEETSSAPASVPCGTPRPPADRQVHAEKASHAPASMPCGTPAPDRQVHAEKASHAPASMPVFVQSFAPAPRMLVFGGVDYAAAVVRIGRFLGYRVTVCDARPVFATRRRFPDADDVVCEWPANFLARTAVDERAAICVLTHDPKFDTPLLRAALRSPAGYVGAMGSRRTHADRLRRLRADGLTEAELARLHSPVGLDIGARTPEETAVSIAAEIIQARYGGTGRPLRSAHGPIHPSPPRRD
jgi:xanthine dehydrogenase accessory factor